MSPSNGAATARPNRPAAARVSRSTTAAPAGRAGQRTAGNGARRPHLQVAPETSRRLRRTRRAVWALSILSVAAVFCLLAFHVVAVQNSFQMDRLERDRATEERRYERLREQVATLSAPEAVVANATRLGMVVAPHVEAIEAPPAAPQSTSGTGDPTADTLGKSWDEAKKHLGADP